MAYQVVYTDSV